MKPVRVKVGEGGRIVIPAEFRKAIGVRNGDVLILSLKGNELHLFTVAEAVRQAQEVFSKYLPEEHAIVDEFIADRRAEAARE
ncbi:MAG TPA: AbrB/MazE/SpoVT family DNA-binding domain-containing protein [Dehalococcoidia bacterium]|nr:AbrB/MazE/SpoVT family DNA-binding domain-containing protein [Dehalococcoidia bacterium]